MAGIYKIVYKDSVYIGSTVRSFKQRWKEHRGQLKAGKGNRILQRVYNKHGLDVLHFEILQELNCSMVEMRKIEQEYILDAVNKLGRKYVLNSTLNTKSALDDPEMLANRSKNEHWLNSVRERCKIIQPMAARAIAEKSAKYYSFLSPDGILYTGKGLRPFCREQNLNQGGMWCLLNKKYDLFKGWMRYEAPYEF